MSWISQTVAVSFRINARIEAVQWCWCYGYDAGGAVGENWCKADCGGLKPLRTLSGMKFSRGSQICVGDGFRNGLIGLLRVGGHR